MSGHTLLYEKSEDLNEEASSVESYDEMPARSGHFSIDVKMDDSSSSRTLLKQSNEKEDTLMLVHLPRLQFV